MLGFVLDPVFGPLLALPQPWPILIVSLVATLIVTLIYKFATDQTAMKAIKDEVKVLQNKIKELKENPKEAMEVQKEAMEKQMKLMKHSFKPMLLTFIPVIIIFGWLNANMIYEPIMPGQEFSTTVYFMEGSGGEVTIAVPEGVEVLENETKEIDDDKASWGLKGEEGEYTLKYNYNEKVYSKDVLITADHGYKEPVKKFKKNVVKSIEISQKKITVMNLFGLKMGWLATYIIFSIILSMILRKLLKVQ